MAQSKTLKFLRKRALNIIFRGSEYATDLIIANTKTLSHDDSYTQLFQMIVSFLGRGHGSLVPLWIRHLLLSTLQSLEFTAFS